MIYRLIAAKWAQGLKPDVLEGEFTSLEEIQEKNAQGYHCYYLPNYPSKYDPSRKVEGKDVDVFNYCFVDMDIKHGDHASKDAFIELLAEIPPTSIVDSGNGIHAYWRVTDLDAMSYLMLQRRLCRKFKTDPAVAKIYQLLRMPGTVNIKDIDNPKLCELIWDEGPEYTAEELDRMLPKISLEDEQYCQNHYDKTYNFDESKIQTTGELPARFRRLCKSSAEIKKLFYGPVKDRSAADYRLTCLLHSHDFTREEAVAVMFNSAKACERAPIHRYNYADSLVEKIYGNQAKETAQESDEKETPLVSRSVVDIRAAAAKKPKNTRFPCDEMFDATYHGFRLTEVMGLIGGAGNGKTTTSLNMFKGFVQLNPLHKPSGKKYIHLFVSLEQPEEEIAERWAKIAGEDEHLASSVHVLGNYNEDGTYRNLSLDDIQKHILSLEQATGRKVGCVVIDHIGVLKQERKSDEHSGLIGVCKQMKSLAISTQTFLIMQSQTSRAKSGNGDIELDLDAAYGTAHFEFFCDYVITTWQPLKRIYDRAPQMTVMAFKFCKIRVLNVEKDKAKKDQVYTVMFDQYTETLRRLTTDEEKAVATLADQATKLRNKDKKREPAPLKTVHWIAEVKPRGK